MSRQKNPQHMMSWSVISAGVHYGKVLGDIDNRRSTYLGGSATTRSFLRIVEPHAESMLSSIDKNVSALLKTVWMIDDNQKCHPKNFQRVGSSNRFLKVTGRS